VAEVLATSEMRWLSFRLAYFYGKDAATNKKWAKAESHLQEALQYFPRHPQASLALAEALWNQGKKEAARQQIHSLEESEPGLSPVSYLLGLFSKEEGNLEQARTYLEEAVLRDSKNIEAWYELGKIYIGLSETEKALQALEQVTRVDPFITRSRFLELKEKVKVSGRMQP